MGEVGLTGEVRAVTALPARLKEAAALGFQAAVVPQNNLRGGADHPIEVLGVSSVEDAVKTLQRRALAAMHRALAGKGYGGERGTD